MSAWLWLACASDPVHHAVHGTVVEVRPPDRVVIAHDAIPGFMDAMTMPFAVQAPATLEGVRPGDEVTGDLVVEGSRSALVALAVVSRAEQPPALAPGESVPVGALFPATEVQLAQGSSVTLGVGQEGTWAVTFFYTRCPLPEFCPLVMTRMVALQAALPDHARILAITLDPANDTRGTLKDFAAEHGAVPGRFDLGRVPHEVLYGLAEKAGLKTAGGGKLEIVHDLVLLILDRQGRLVARYTDMSWDQAEVVERLR